MADTMQDRDNLDAAKRARDEREGDARPDIEQAVEARADAVARGEGGGEPETFTAPGDYSGIAGTGGEVKNQGADAQ